MVDDACAICAKFHDEGPLAGPWIWQDDLGRVAHVQPDPGTTLALGHLIVDPVRTGRLDDDHRKVIPAR